MDTTDARSLSAAAQEALRKRAVKAVLDGMTHEEVGKVFGVARGTVSRWMQIHRRQGETGLKARRQGRPPGSRLKGHQAATIVRMITDRYPEQLKLPFVLWTREAVAELIERRLGLRVSLSTVGRYLRRWGFTPQKPARRAFEQNPAAVEHWLKLEYPRIQAVARREGAEIHWGDEMGLRSDHQAGQCWAPKGKTPVISGTGQRFRCNMISSITNRGTLRFRVFHGSFTTDVFMDFLERLIKSCEAKIFLIVDRHPVHRARKVTHWLEKHKDRIKLIFLPAYSPHLNPDEYLNHDVKANSVGRRRPRNRDEMTANVRSYLRSTQKQPEIVKRFFLAESVRYAA
jgi:transposase